MTRINITVNGRSLNGDRLDIGVECLKEIAAKVAELQVCGNETININIVRVYKKI